MKKKASVKHKMHQKSKERKSLKEKRSKRHMPQKRQLQEKPELLLKGKTVPQKTLDAKSIVQILEYKTLFGSIWKPTPSIEKLLSKISVSTFNSLNFPFKNFSK